jgi:hypothetical protein
VDVARVCVLAAVAAMGGSASSSGQAVEELSALPIAGRTLTIGAEVRGTLTVRDPTADDGAHLQAWGLELVQGQPATVDLVSDVFDAFLLIVGPGLADPITDDDGAGGCDARVTFTAPASGVFRVVASSMAAGEIGRYRLRVSALPGPVYQGECASFSDDGFGDRAAWLEALPTDGRRLTMGGAGEGALRESDSVSWDGSYVQAWALALEAGQEATVDLTSADFDAYLMVVGPGLEQILSDDDGGGACHARISFTAPEAGEYRAIANTLHSRTTGRYRVAVSDRPGPVSEEGCGTTGDAFDLPAEERAELGALPVVGRLRIGHEMSGELAADDAKIWDDSYAEAWELELDAGQEVTVDLVSDAFDALLVVLGPGDFVARNDDGGGACHARLTITADVGGTYRVVVNSIASEASGVFTLRVSREPGPRAEGECGG